MGRKIEYNHGFERHSIEWDRMVYICNKYRISNQEYCENIENYRKKPKKVKIVSTRSKPKYQYKSKEYKKDGSLRSKYKITLEDYNSLFCIQQGKCAICGTHQSLLPKSLAVDHCHDTEKVRGLLCQNCNTGIGLLKDSSDILLKATLYLTNYGK